MSTSRKVQYHKQTSQSTPSPSHLEFYRYVCINIWIENVVELNIKKANKIKNIVSMAVVAWTTSTAKNNKIKNKDGKCVVIKTWNGQVMLIASCKHTVRLSSQRPKTGFNFFLSIFMVNSVILQITNLW